MALVNNFSAEKKKQKPAASESQKLQPSKRRRKQQIIKNLLTCKRVEERSVHDPSKTISIPPPPPHQGYYKLGSTCSSICSFKDVVHGSTRVVHRGADNNNSSPDESSSVVQETRVLGNKKSAYGSSSSMSLGGSVRSSGGSSAYTISSSRRGMQFRKLSGCYECRMIVDPSRYPMPRTTICACSECGEIFTKMESLEHHQAVKHAVSELDPKDSSRNVVEIIFKSSWLKNENPVCKIERILKVHNAQKTIQRFEDYREAVKTRAANGTNKRAGARCAADGNELLRFYCTTLTCSLGSCGSTSLCGSVPGCEVCSIIRHGFQGNKTSGVCTLSSSGRAHDCHVDVNARSRRAMLVCRVIAGRVKRMVDDAVPKGEIITTTVDSYDSVAGFCSGAYADLEELYVFNRRAILPCFVVIYKALES